jgi:DNA (cytosine-5)-methyltransferase 1
LNYYNEIDPFCAQWLQNLMDADHIAQGDIDTRSIEDVRPSDLAGYVQCHFFAGLGGWAYALDLAGWPRDRPVWTGSCPCQPFSQAGEGAGFADERHLWPAWHHLISQCQPAVVFGEQVAAAIGKQWLDGVCADLEGNGYAIGSGVLPACAVGAPHRRDRLWFVADSSIQGLAQRIGNAGVLRTVGSESERQDIADDSGAMAYADQLGTGAQRTERSGQLSRLSSHSWSRDSSTIIGHDGKARRVEPGICLLAHGVPGRVGKLRALGNAIVPQAAAEFVAAYMDVQQPPMQMEVAHA